MHTFQNIAPRFEALRGRVGDQLDQHRILLETRDWMAEAGKLTLKHTIDGLLEPPSATTPWLRMAIGHSTETEIVDISHPARRLHRPQVSALSAQDAFAAMCYFQARTERPLENAGLTACPERFLCRQIFREASNHSVPSSSLAGIESLVSPAWVLKDTSGQTIRLTSDWLTIDGFLPPPSYLVHLAALCAHTCTRLHNEIARRVPPEDVSDTHWEELHKVQQSIIVFLIGKKRGEAQVQSKILGPNGADGVHDNGQHRKLTNKLCDPVIGILKHIGQRGGYVLQKLPRGMPHIESRHATWTVNPPSPVEVR